MPLGLCRIKEGWTNQDSVVAGMTTVLCKSLLHAAILNCGIFLS